MDTFDISKFLKEGQEVEKRFVQDCDEFIRPSTRSENIYDHWDVLVKLKGEKMKVDVKGVKRQKRNLPLDETIHWVEIMKGKNVKGWLYGKADYFSFEMNDKWIIVPRQDLKEFVEKNTIKEYKKEPTLYHLYKAPTRTPNFTSIITLVESQKLIEISKYVIPKQNYL